MCVHVCVLWGFCLCVNFLFFHLCLYCMSCIYFHVSFVHMLCVRVLFFSFFAIILFLSPCCIVLSMSVFVCVCVCVQMRSCQAIAAYIDVLMEVL